MCTLVGYQRGYSCGQIAFLTLHTIPRCPCEVVCITNLVQENRNSIRDAQLRARKSRTEKDKEGQPRGQKKMQRQNCSQQWVSLLSVAACLWRQLHQATGVE